MAFLKNTGKALGGAAGFVTGEPIKYIGKKVKSDYIQEIGEDIKKATQNTGSTLGSVAEGTWNTSSGLLNKDNEKRDAGLNELKKTAVNMAKGMGESIKSTYGSGKDVVQGIAANNQDQILKGAKEIGKKVAVAVIAVGVLDVLDVIDLDGADDHVDAAMLDQDEDFIKLDDRDDGGNQESMSHFETRNESLEGEHHPVTGVEFESQSVTLPSGEQIEGVFPEFESEYTVSLPESMYLENDDSQFSYANQSLAEAINQNPDLGHQYTSDQLQQIYSNTTPDGYVWHHNAEPGQLDLVNEEIHAETGHTGGRELWGGGSEHRK